MVGGYHTIQSQYLANLSQYGSRLAGVWSEKLLLNIEKVYILIFAYFTFNFLQCLSVCLIFMARHETDE